MFSWLKKFGGSTNGDRDEYEPLYPLPPPRRGQTQMLKYAMLSGIVCLGVAAVLVVLIINSTEQPEAPTLTGNVALTPSLILQAAGDPLPVEAEEDSADRPNEAAQPLVENLVTTGHPNVIANSTTTVKPAVQVRVTSVPAANVSAVNVPAANVSAVNVPAANVPVSSAPAEVTQAPVEEDILVETDQGTLRGLKFKSRAGRVYFGFLGVPYAKPPLGELRFKPPVEAEPWEGTLNATEIPVQCIQKDKYNEDPSVVVGDEDCLYLNIYTPKNVSELGGRRVRNRFPVMLYIHGGGPTGNASRYRPDYFMDENVVLITLNYRLGALGNLNTNDSSARGNQGLKDQVIALQWIKDNIKNFGGNQRKVTLFGNSYGGAEVHTHLLSSMSKRLFHRAISESGSILFPDMINENPSKTAFDLGDKVNCTSNNSTELVDCLRNVSAVEIVRRSYNDQFVTSIEPPAQENDEDTFLSAHPLTLLQNGNINDVPVIFGVNSGEALMVSLSYLLTQNLTDYLNANFNTVVVESTQLNVTATDPYAIGEAAHQFYLGGKNVSRETQGNWTNLISDYNYIHPVHVSANFQSENNGRRNNVYFYYFNWEVAQKYSRKAEAIYKPDHFLGASHADELQMLFPYDDFPYIPLDSIHANLSQTMVKLWVSFAADGKPSGTTNEWLPIKANQKPFKLFELNSNSLQMIDPIGERMAFWDQYNITDLYQSKDPLNTRSP